MAVDSYGSQGEPLFDESKPSNTAADLNAISEYLVSRITGTTPSWVPTIDGVANSSEGQGAYVKVGGYCVAHAFFRLANGNYPSSGSNYLNLPLAATALAGVPYAIGTVEFTRRSDGARAAGRVMQSTAFTSNAAKALLYADSSPSGGGLNSSTLFVGQSPLTIGSTDALYLNLRLLYWVG